MFFFFLKKLLPQSSSSSEIDWYGGSGSFVHQVTPTSDSEDRGT